MPSTAVAEEVVQDTWIAVIKGIGGFEGRSTLRTWIFRILANQARTRGVRERRTVPASSLADELAEAEQPSVASSASPGRRGGACGRSRRRAGAISPRSGCWSGATFEHFAETVKTLPENQRRVRGPA